LSKKLPPNWTAKTLEEVVQISSGTTPLRTKQSLYFDGGTIPWVKTGDLNNGVIRATEECITEVAKRECSSCTLYPVDTVLVAMYGGFRQIGRTGRLAVPAAINQALSALQVKNGDLWPAYLQIWLNGRVGLWKRLAASSRKDPNITGSDVAAFPIVLPPVSEQKEIAAVLSSWDLAIELAEKLIAATHQRKAALMQQLLTGRVRFRQFVQSDDRHHTPVGEMPLDWKSHKLASVTSKVKRKNSVGEGHVLTASGEHGLVDQREFFNRSVASTDLSGYYLLKRGEFAYNRSAMNGYPFGAIKRLDRYDQGVLSTLYICFGLVDDGTCDSDFMAHYFEARLLDRQLGEVTQVGGRAHGLLNITDGDFYSMQVVLPGVEEQQKIASVLNEQQREIEVIEQKLDALRRQKAGLMQQLLTGRVRVRLDDTPGG
jgi:type I restriction enzyme S subunit